jgi:hypothetical protein
MRLRVSLPKWWQRSRRQGQAKTDYADVAEKAAENGFFVAKGSDSNHLTESNTDIPPALNASRTAIGTRCGTTEPLKRVSVHHEYLFKSNPGPVHYYRSTWSLHLAKLQEVSGLSPAVGVRSLTCSSVD